MLIQIKMYVSDESIYKDIVVVNCLFIINEVKKTVSSYLQQN
jgi:hypothetical protein